MSLFGLEVKSARDARAIAHAVSGTSAIRGQPLYTVNDWDYEEAVEKAFRRSVWVFRCIDAIASNQAFIPIYLRKGFERDHQVLPDPRLYKLLNYKPNHYETAFQFRWRLSAQLLLSQKGAFIEIVRDNTGEVHSLHLIPPHRIAPIRDDAKFVSGYEVWDVNGAMAEKPLRPDQVIWIKVKPHPTDPYLQMTPLMSLGLTIDNDMLARLFNANFLQQDGRPGTLIAIKGELDPTVAQEMGARFAGGPLRAGQVFIIDGAENVEIKDMSATPRDIQWAEALLNNKYEILTGFGVGEAVLGSAGGRTFDNADAEYEVFWVQTMKPHCEAIAGGLDKLTKDLEDDVFLQFDYNEVDVLQRQERNRHAKIFDEWRVGGMSFNEFRKRTGQPTWDSVAAEMVFLTNGAVIAKPENLQDVANVPILGITPGEDTEEAQVRGELASYRQFQIEQDRAAANAQAATATVSNAAAQLQQARTTDAAPTQPTTLSKEAPQVETKTIEMDTTHPYLTTRIELESSVVGVLTAWNNRQESVVLSRLEHVKSREGTRHWEGATGETKTLDASYSVEVARWADDATKDIEELIRTVVNREGLAAARDAQRQSGGSMNGKGAADKVYGSKQAFDATVERIVSNVLQAVYQSTKGQSQRVIDKIEQAENDGASMAQIKAQVKELMGTRSAWRVNLARSITTQAIEGIKYETYGHMPGATKIWNTERDERVRVSHYDNEKSERPLDKPFIVGGKAMQYPGDLAGGLDQVINCRCWLTFKMSR